jgi:hypothetical protein
VTTAIVPVTTAIAQSKKMQIRLEIEKKRRKQGKKLEVFFYVFLIFSKLAKNRQFWWPPRLSGGDGPEPPKWKLQEPPQGKLGLPEVPKWNLWEAPANLVMILVISKMIINRQTISNFGFPMCGWLKLS